MRVFPGLPTVARGANTPGIAALLVALAVAAFGAAMAAAPTQAPPRTPPRTTQPPPRTTPAPSAKRAVPAPAKPRNELAVPFHVGETLTFDVAWSGYLIAGSAVSRVVEKRPSYNSSAYYLVADGRPLPIIARLYPLYYKMDALFDSFTSLSQRTSLYQEEGAQKRYLSTLFNRPARRAVIERQEEPGAKNEIDVPTDAQDGLTLLYALRTRAFKAGDRLTYPVVDEGTVYSVTFDVGAPEIVKVPFGPIDAWNLRVSIAGPDKQPVGKNIAVWLSNDARHLPVKLQADLPVGAFVLALRTVESPATR